MTTITWPDDVALALNYVRGDAHRRMDALMRFDRVLAAIVSGARDPTLAQLRLTWWRTQLDAPVTGSDGYEASALFGAALLPVIDGWERLLAPLPFDEETLRGYAEGRGMIFTLLGGCLSFGAGWALADLARHCTDAVTRDRASQMAVQLLGGNLRSQPKPLRVLARMARADQITRWTLLRAALS